MDGLDLILHAKACIPSDMHAKLYHTNPSVSKLTPVPSSPSYFGRRRQVKKGGTSKFQVEKTGICGYTVADHKQDNGTAIKKKNIAF